MGRKLARTPANHSARLLRVVAGLEWIWPRRLLSSPQCSFIGHPPPCLLTIDFFLPRRAPQVGQSVDHRGYLVIMLHQWEVADFVQEILNPWSVLGQPDQARLDKGTQRRGARNFVVAGVDWHHRNGLAGELFPQTLARNKPLLVATARTNCRRAQLLDKRLAAGGVFDQQRRGCPTLVQRQQRALEVGKLDPFPPKVEQVEVSTALRPDLADAVVLFLALFEIPAERQNDSIDRRHRFGVIAPEPVGLDHPAAQRCRPLLVLAREPLLSHHPLDLCNLLWAFALRPQQPAVVDDLHPEHVP